MLKQYLSLASLFDPITLASLIFKWLRWWATFGRQFQQNKQEPSPVSIDLICEERIVRFKSGYVIHSQLPPVGSEAFDNMAFPKKQRHLSASHPLYPSFANLALTSQCPLNCWHCSAHGHTRAQPDLAPATWKRIIQQLQDAGVYYLGITGGEPLMREDLEEIIACIDGRSVVAMATSGVGLTLERAQRLRSAGVFYLLVSLDDPQPDEHDRLRGFHGAYEAAINAMHLAREVGFYTIIQAIVTKEFVAHGTVCSMAELGKKIGIQEIRLRGVVPSGKVLRLDRDRLLSEQDSQKLLADISALRGSPAYPKLSLFEEFEHATRFGCNAGSMHTYVDSAGNLCPCDFVPMHFGNLAEEPFEAVWQRMRSRLGTPQTSCLANFTAAYAVGHEISTPLSYEESCRLCQLYRKPELPGAYLTTTQNA